MSIPDKLHVRDARHHDVKVDPLPIDPVDTTFQRATCQRFFNYFPGIGIERHIETGHVKALYGKPFCVCDRARHCKQCR
jgi:hypothetical protein